jgi:chromate transporter
MAKPAPPTQRPGLARLFLTFARIGLLSFGGGQTAIVFSEQEVVERGRWLSADDYDRAYALSRMYPGIHVLAQAVLIGYLVRGWGGALACSLGLLALSSAATLALAASYAELRANPVIANVMDEVLAATAGLTFGLGVRLARETTQHERGATRAITILLVLAGFVLLGLLRVNAALVVLLAGLAGVFLYRVGGGGRGPA